MDLLIHIASWLLLCALLYTLWKTSQPNSNRNRVLPPEIAGAWPIIGHLHLLRAQIPLARILAAIADKHGRIFSLWLGMHRVVVISDREFLKQCFTTHDKALAGRPESTAGEYLGYNYAGFGFLSYGPYWRKIRKLVLSEVLSARRLEKFSHSRVSEVEISIRELHAAVIAARSPATGEAMINISHWLETLTLNLIVKIIAGKRYKTHGLEDHEANQSRKAVTEFLTLSGQSVLSDMIPITLLRWVDIKGVIKSMKRIKAEMDVIIGSWIDEHCERASENERDFIDVLLSLVTDDLLEYGHTKRTIIKATIVTLLVGGSDTTAITLTWVLSLLLNNRDALQRAQKEIDIVVGVERWVEESDIKNLPYLQAIVKETLRMYPPVPLSVPHVATEDCDVAGYNIPRGTHLLVNLWKLHRDPEVWADAEEFRPERFLPGGDAYEVDFLGQHFEFIPFGSGRRSCPGITFAMQVNHLVLARLLQGFEFSMSSYSVVDMTEGLSISLPKAIPLEILVAPRLPSLLY
nr:cytochrome P450 CYP82D47-like [Ipomoea batatas]